MSKTKKSRKHESDSEESDELEKKKTKHSKSKKKRAPSTDSESSSSSESDSSNSSAERKAKKKHKKAKKMKKDKKEFSDEEPAPHATKWDSPVQDRMKEERQPDYRRRSPEPRGRRSPEERIPRRHEDDVRGGRNDRISPHRGGQGGGGRRGEFSGNRNFNDRRPDNYDRRDNRGNFNDRRREYSPERDNRRFDREDPERRFRNGPPRGNFEDRRNERYERNDRPPQNRDRKRSHSRERFQDDRERDRGRERSRDRERDRKPFNRKQRRSNDREDNKDYDWGKRSDNPNEEEKPVEKEKPNFGLSGKLTEETNKVNGIVIKYAEPAESKKPKRRWRLYPFKGETALPTLYIHRQSAYLIGRDRKICDIAVDHPSCSKQHAALQYRLVPYERDDGSTGKRVRPYLIDLESSNGTFVNNKKIEAKKYVELLEKDVIKFGFSSREYVLLHENSKEDKLDDDVFDEPEEKED